MNWTIEARGDVRELYGVVADSEEEARAKFECGDVNEPYLSEAEGVSIFRIASDT